MNIDDMIIILNQAKQDMVFGEIISKLFFPNNEVFFQYLLDKHKIKWFNLPYEWHTYFMVDDKIKDISKAKLIHLINKRFEELWELI